jgi:GAF domain-containing protein
MGTQLAAETLRQRVLGYAAQLTSESTRRQRTLLDQIAETLANEVGDTCCIALLEHGRLNPVALGHRDRAARRLLESLVRLPLGVSAIPAANIVMVTQQPMRTETMPLPVMLSMFPRLAPYVKRYPIEAMLSLPLRGEPKAVGAIGFVRHQKDHPYTDEDQAFLTEIADAIAAGLQRPSAQ